MSRRGNKENNMGKTMQRLQHMIMKKRLFDVQVEQIKKYLKKKKKNRAISIYKLSRAEYKKLAHL